MAHRSPTLRASPSPSGRHDFRCGSPISQAQAPLSRAGKAFLGRLSRLQATTWLRQFQAAVSASRYPGRRQSRPDHRAQRADASAAPGSRRRIEVLAAGMGGPASELSQPSAPAASAFAVLCRCHLALAWHRLLPGRSERKRLRYWLKRSRRGILQPAAVRTDWQRLSAPLRRRSALARRQVAARLTGRSTPLRNVMQLLMSIRPVEITSPAQLA